MTIQPPMEYAPQAPRTGLAMTSMILGIVGLLTGCLGIGILLGIVGLVLGVIALVNINKNPTAYGGKGLAITGIITSGLAVLVMPLLLFAILLPSLGRARELSNRAACGANMRGIAQSLNIYAADNSDAFPVLPYAPYSAANAGTSTDVGTTTADDTLKAMYASSGTQNGSPLAAIWLLTLKNYTSPKQYICKSDPFAGPDTAKLTDGSNFYENIQAQNQISYSFAYPYATDGKVGNWWKNTTDSSLPIAGDMAPLNGTGSPARNVAPGATPSNARSWNSGNHQGDGQNIAFADGHAEFVRRADVGQDNDNIFTASGMKGVSQYGGTQPGKAPIDLQTETAPFDVVFVPARDLNTGGL